MSAPSLTPVWDTNGTHVTADIASGHKTDGLGANEVPASDEWNTLIRFLCLWVAYLKGLTGTQTIVVPILTAGVANSPGLQSLAVAHNVSPNLTYVGLPALTVGSKITAIRTRVQENGVAGISIWVATTTYIIGNRVKNGANIYKCTATGTSAGSGGPTGTGTGIIDNTCHWDFVVAAGSAGDGVVGMSLVSDTDGGLVTIASVQGNNATDALAHSINLTGLSTVIATGVQYMLVMTNSGVGADNQILQNVEMDVTILP